VLKRWVYIVGAYLFVMGILAVYATIVGLTPMLMMTPAGGGGPGPSTSVQTQQPSLAQIAYSIVFFPEYLFNIALNQVSNSALIIWFLNLAFILLGLGLILWALRSH